MLSVIWTVFKILLLVILILLTVALVLCALILFAPITYHGTTSYKDRFESSNRFRWLWIIASIRCGYDETVYAELSLLWHKIDLLSDDEEEDEDSSEDNFFEDDSYMNSDGVNDSSSTKDTSDDSIEAKDSSTTSDSDHTDSSNKKSSKKRSKKERKKISLISIIKHKKEELLDKLRNINEKKNTILDIIHDERNIRLWNLLKKSVIKLLKHILPRRCTGKLLYGFDDPYYTGKLLSYISLMPWAYNKDITIVPVFDRPVIDGEISYKGHIQVGVVLYILLRVWFDKNFKRVYNLYKNR